MHNVVLDRMFETGGSFARQLSKTAVNADSWRGFTRELVELYAAADAQNRARIVEGFPNIWACVSMTESERYAHLQLIFPEVFERYMGVRA